MTIQSQSRKLRPVITTLAAIAVAIGLAGCSASCSVSVGGEKKGGTYSEHGVSLTVPDGWLRVKSTTEANAGNELWSQGFSPARSGKDGVILTAYQTNVAITPENVDQYASQVADVYAGLVRAAEGTITSGPGSATVAGLAGYTFESSVPAEEGSLESRIVMVWSGKTEYYLNCQHVAGSPRTTEIENGCNTIIDSFKVG
jgi:hypothetical protein